ncbi:hybrid-cluster NAD(P)-dependent oxidoreductase [Brevibacterium casei]|uniref:hybrid-cluster NAD(P)-dependent oxidoreductase n=1 Tax=Brevibacterium casei TaxID=33889 RepID=UPI001E44E0E6|nr:hybrid-cluster NAD(P)-dependent oxidoreductase [Brevibacterium casei]MCT1549709.1 hybrid-cluster NAD(P)-dependent oxidoreductase [Brevibacterium casei]MCT1561397.1 hybrid-cluster NAD(P)-dependent oxidoreductase [Brevibacterium casei]MCT2207750.1 hybrid-cluster NAD(P)-dependent oxidoreductase [Brevibacterium casei]
MGDARAVGLAVAAATSPAATSPAGDGRAGATPASTPAARLRGTDGLRDTGELRDADEFRDTDEGITGLAVCTAITANTHDVITIELWTPWLNRADFEPGQYLTVHVPELGLDRCYSISSAPFGTNTLTITVKRQAGPVSAYLHDRLRVGDRLHVDGPYGLFSTSFHPARRHLFVSAGSGITPIMSMVRALLARNPPETIDIVLLHSASTPDDIVFRTELDQLAEVPGITVITMCSRDSATEVWSGPRGRIRRDVLESVTDLTEREAFVCGPSGFMDTVRSLLAEAGVSRVHEETFAFATTPAQRLARRRTPATEGVGATVSAGLPFTVEFAASGLSVDCDAETTVLDAALAAGLTVPSSCESGMCGTCKSDLLSGEVEMSHEGGIRPKEIAAGKFLPCCSTPLSDLVIDR